MVVDTWDYEEMGDPMQRGFPSKSGGFLWEGLLHPQGPPLDYSGVTATDRNTEGVFSQVL